MLQILICGMRLGRPLKEKERNKQTNNIARKVDIDNDGDDENKANK
jgi:hypothetical protein